MLDLLTNSPAETAARLAGERAIGRVTLAVEGGDAPREVLSPEAGAAEVFDILMPCEGELRFCQGDLSGACAPGGYVLLRRDRFHELSSPAGEGGLRRLRISLPAADLRARIAAADDHCGMRFHQDPAMAAMLARFAELVAETFARRPPPNAEAFATEIIALAALAISAELRTETASARNSRHHLKRRVIEFVEANLADSELSPRRIADANRISSSYLYSLFSDTNTTVAQFIQARRLQRAYELLVGDPRGALTVSEIAYMVGFKNPSHFSRSFSRHFRVAPRDARHAGLSAAAPRRAGGRAAAAAGAAGATGAQASAA